MGNLNFFNTFTVTSLKSHKWELNICVSTPQCLNYPNIHPYMTPNSPILGWVSFLVQFKKHSCQPPSCPQGQTAVSLHCDTWVIQGQSFNGAAEASVFWLVHWIHAWGTGKIESVHQQETRLLHHSGNTKDFHLYPVLSKYSGLSFTLLPSHSVYVEMVTLAQVLNLFYFSHWNRKDTSYQQRPWLWQVWILGELRLAVPAGRVCHRSGPLSHPSSLLWCNPPDLQIYKKTNLRKQH